MQVEKELQLSKTLHNFLFDEVLALILMHKIIMVLYLNSEVLLELLLIRSLPIASSGMKNIIGFSHCHSGEL